MNFKNNKFIMKLKKIIIRNDDDYFWELRTKTLTEKNIILKLFYQYKYAKLMKEMGSSIPLETIIQNKPRLPHSIYGIFISKKARIGKNCTIFQQVTIGSNYIKESKGYGFPTIGDNVYIGVGAKIIGNVTVGNNVKIGANAVIIKNIPDNSTVVTESVRILEKK